MSMRELLSLLIWPLIALSFVGPEAVGQQKPEALESSVLRLELNSNPYSYKLIERSTGEVLVSQSGATSFRNIAYTVKSASDVVSSEGSLEATLQLSETPDPAHVVFTFVRPEIVQVLLTFKDAPPNEIREEFIDRGEHYYGIWEYPFGGNIDNRGADRDFLGFEHLPDVNYSNARAPFYMTSRKYGIYVESVAEGHYSIAQAGKTSFSFKEPQLRYDIIYGPSYAEILNRYNAIAGPSIMPPGWAFGSIWWRDDYHEDLRRANNAQAKVIDDADRLRALHTPAGSIWLDRPYGSGDHGWGNMDFDSSFPNPGEMIRDLAGRGFKLLLWIANRCSNQLFEEGSAKGYLFPFTWPAADVKRPEVYKWFKEKLDVYVRQGVRGYKIDRGEEHELPETFENENAILFPKLAAEGLRDVYGDDFFMFTRNVNDTARKYTAVWNGDTRSTFGGLSVSIKNGLRSGLINFPMWGSDTGGYIRVPDKELFARWLEFSAYSPMMEILIGPKRTIWDDYDNELVSIAQTCVTAHRDLIPYTRSYLYQATRTGMPVMRALFLAYPSDPRVADLWDEYLYGQDLLVAPVVAAGAASRKVYLPAGRWLDYNNKQTQYPGGTEVSASAPLGTIPLFVRQGAILPLGDVIQLNNNWDSPWTPKLHIELFPGTETSEFDYFNGSAVKKIVQKPAKDGIDFSMEDLGANGTLEVYCRNVRAVRRNGTTLRPDVDYQFDSHRNKLTVPFTGATEVSITGAKSIFTP